MSEEKKADPLGDQLRASLAMRRQEPGTCQKKRCTKPAEYFQYLINDPSAYCRKHALAAAGYWASLGFPSPSYVRLSDGVSFLAGEAGRRESATKEDAVLER